jgi:hypothetical protein
MSLSAIPFVLGAFLLMKQPSLLDLTNFVEKGHRRLPPTHSSGGGMGGGGNGVRQYIPPLKMSLALLGQEESTGEVFYEITLLNSGKEEVQLPWNPDVADMEPKDDGWQHYSYTGFSIGLWTIDDNDRISLQNAIGLYMSHQAPSSSIPLKPGERATIRAKTRLPRKGVVEGQCVRLKAICIPFAATVSIASSGEVREESTSGEGLIAQNEVVVSTGSK